MSAVKFSVDSNYLISGGKETVLVLWQLITGNKQFLPHLTSEIERIVVSPQGDRYAIQLGDNSIMILSTTELKPVANFAGLQMRISRNLEEFGAASKTTILHGDQLLLSVPATQPKMLADVSSRPFLQTFDLRTSRHIARQALTRNNITDFNLSRKRRQSSHRMSFTLQSARTASGWQLSTNGHLRYKTSSFSPRTPLTC